jgi:Ca2+-binding RTX toxin-like protein
MPSYRKFLDALGERESGGDYGVVNSYGYLGKYQFGELALIDVGYYTADGTGANDWKPGFWTGKSGVDSKADFLADAEAQEQAIRAYMKLQWVYLGDTQRYAGQTIGGLKVTESGLLAGAHLLGAGAVAAFLEGGAVAPPSDAYGTAITEYMRLFAGYDTPFAADHAGAETIAGGPKRDILRGFGGADTLLGNDGDDRLKGGRGADLLDGGMGGDRLAGAIGRDVFRFADTPDPDAPDVVRDFRSGRDMIELDRGVFAVLPPGPLDAAMFRAGKARDEDDHILLDRAGALRYDSDGSGGEDAVLIAIIAGHDRPIHADIVVA